MEMKRGSMVVSCYKPNSGVEKEYAGAKIYLQKSTEERNPS